MASSQETNETKSTSSDSDKINFETFTNDSAMMIAYERFLESEHQNSLFIDPFAEKMASTKGKSLSDAFGQYCNEFGFNDWQEFHKTWTAVRTKFIDDHIQSNASSFNQLINLGAGLDTRPYRMECYSAFTNGSFEVDMENVNIKKMKIFKDYLGAPHPYCSAVHNVNLDFLDEKTSLENELKNEDSFDSTQPAIIVSEGLIMYLGEAGKFKLISDLSAIAAPGSIFILQFSEDVEYNSPACLSTNDATSALEKGGWGELVFSKFGDETLNYGRFPTNKYEPSARFSFVVCKKIR